MKIKFSTFDSPRDHPQNRRRTREGSEPACVQTPLTWEGRGVAHAGRELRIIVLPWYRPVGVAIPPVRENRAVCKGKLSPRGTETTVPRPSAPGCGDTLKAQASDQRLIQGGDGPRRRPGLLSTGSPARRTPPHGDGSMYSQANVRTGKVLRPPI